MHRSRSSFSFLPAVAALAALTAVTLLGAAVAIHPPGLPSESDTLLEIANRRLAHRFYDAATVVIATGDLTPLAAVVTPDLLADAGDGKEGSVGLARRLLSLHATAPTLRLSVTDLAADGDLVIVRVATEGTGPTMFLGIRLTDAPVPWGPIDVLRLADGRIVEYESGQSQAILLEPAFEFPWRPLPVSSTDSPVLTVSRIEIASGAVHRTSGVVGGRLLIVVAGAVTVEANEFASADDVATPRQAGEYLVVLAGTTGTVVNTGEAPAVLIELNASPFGCEAAQPSGMAPSASKTCAATSLPSFTEHPAFVAARQGGATRDHLNEPSSSTGGVTAEIVVRRSTIEAAEGPAVLAFGWITLEPGARLAWEAAGPVLLYVAAGTPRLEPAWAVAALRDGVQGTALAGNGPPLTTGGGVVISAGEAAVRAGDASATLLIVTLMPAPGRGEQITPAATIGP